MSFSSFSITSTSYCFPNMLSQCCPILVCLISFSIFSAARLPNPEDVPAESFALPLVATAILSLNVPLALAVETPTSSLDN